jgi:hypothetical protein
VLLLLKPELVTAAIACMHTGTTSCKRLLSLRRDSTLLLAAHLAHHCYCYCCCYYCCYCYATAATGSSPLETKADSLIAYVATPVYELANGVDRVPGASPVAFIVAGIILTGKAAVTSSISRTLGGFSGL